jgi:hypothetical protein
MKMKKAIRRFCIARAIAAFAVRKDLRSKFWLFLAERF